MDETRFQRWVESSHSLNNIKPYMIVLAQGLGKLDVRLIDETQAIATRTPDVQAALRLTEHHFLSYLWVLGGYELVRAMDQRSREDASLLPEDIVLRLKTLKGKFERLRIPLAKLEPARAHRQTDYPIAWPVVHQVFGAGWQVSEDTYVTRRELADALLELLECMRAGAERGSGVTGQAT